MEDEQLGEKEDTRLSSACYMNFSAAYVKLDPIRTKLRYVLV